MNMDDLGALIKENNNDNDNNNVNNNNNALFDNTNDSDEENDDGNNNNNNGNDNNNDNNNVNNNANNNQQNQDNNNNIENENENENNNNNALPGNNDNNNVNNDNNNNNIENNNNNIENNNNNNGNDNNNDNNNGNNNDNIENNKVNNKVKKKKKNKNDKLDESIESADIIMDHSSDSDDERTEKQNINNKKNKKKNSENVSNNLSNSNRANLGSKRPSQVPEKNLKKSQKNKNKNNKSQSESSDEESSDKSDQEEENEYSADDNMSNNNNRNSVHKNENDVKKKNVNKKKKVSQRNSQKSSNEDNDLNEDDFRNFFDDEYLKGNEAIECDYENKTITITVGQLKYVFDGSKGKIAIRNKSDDSEAEAPIQDKDLQKIDVQSSENEAKIIIKVKKKLQRYIVILPRYIIIKNKQLIQDMNSFEKTEIETELFKPGIVYRFVDHYLKNYSKLSDVKLLYDKLSNEKQSPRALQIKCTSGEKDVSYPKFIYSITQKRMWYFTEKDVFKRIDPNKVVANIGKKMVKFEIIDDNRRPIIYTLPISDKFIKLLKQTDKKFTADSNKYNYIEIDFNALCDVVEINNVPHVSDVTYAGLTITGVQKVLDDLYEFNTNIKNICIRYNATDKNFEYIENGECVKTYDILSYKNKGKNKGGSLYLSNRGGEKKHRRFDVSNEEMKSFFKKLCGESTEMQLLIKGKDLTDALKDKCKEKKPNFFSNLVDGLKKPKGIKYITGKEITIANEGENLVFSLDENGENKITIPIRDFLFGNLAAFTCQRKNKDYHITYYDDALVLERKTDPNSRSTIIIDFKQMLQEQNLDTEQHRGLDDMKSFLIRIKAAEKKQQEQEKEQLQQLDDDYFFEVENEIISTIYNNGKNIEQAAAYMHLNDYINAYADQEMTENEINFFIDIFGSLNNIDGLTSKINKQIQANRQANNKNVDFNKIFIALMCIAEPEQVQEFTNVFIEEYKKSQNIQQEGDNWPEMNALIAYGYITNDQNQEFKQSVTDYTDRAQQNNVNDIQNNAPEIPTIITDIVSSKKRMNINNGPIKEKNLNIINRFTKGVKSFFGKK